MCANLVLILEWVCCASGNILPTPAEGFAGDCLTRCSLVVGIAAAEVAAESLVALVRIPHLHRCGFTI